jgi:hypothetical protein
MYATAKSIFTTAILTAGFVNTGGEIFSPAVPNEAVGENDLSPPARGWDRQ